MTTRDEKVVAGLSCGDVLARLSEYVDGELAPGDAARVEEHLRGCDGCERFGGEFRAVVRGLRAHLAEPRDVPAGVQEALRSALDREPR